MNRKKVLIITYYWPPSGGSGVQRWLKTARYLRDFGWEPVIYTVENGEYPVLDPTLEKEIPEGITVIRRPIKEPYSFYKKFIGQKKQDRVVSGFLSEQKKPSLKSRIATWIRGNFFIPDARKWWIKPSISFLSDYLKKNPVDLIVSTGPPHSMHLIALGLKKKLNLPWVADFRDPWTNIDFYPELMLTRWADKKHHRLEKEVVTTADRVVVVGRAMEEEFSEIGKRKIDLVLNGFDEADLKGAGPGHPDTKFSLVHIGMLGASRNHPALWEALGDIAKSDPKFQQDLQIFLAGKVDIKARNAIEANGLKSNLELVEYMEHAEAIRRQASAQVLLLLINDTPNAKGVLTGKLFEYLAAQRPILCIGPEDGDAAAVLQECGAGDTAGFSNKEKIKSTILDFYQQFKEGKLTGSSSGVEKYSRRALTGKFASIFNEVVS